MPLVTRNGLLLLLGKLMRLFGLVLVKALLLVKVVRAALFPFVLLRTPVSMFTVVVGLLNALLLLVLNNAALVLVDPMGAPRGDPYESGAAAALVLTTWFCVTVFRGFVVCPYTPCC